MRSNPIPSTPEDLRELCAKLLALANLLEHQRANETFRHDPERLTLGLGRLLEGVAAEIDDIAGNWERRMVRKG